MVFTDHVTDDSKL